MKKVSVLFFALLMISVSVTAKELPVSGKWLLTKVETKGGIEEVYSDVNFKNDGYAEMDGRVFGTWSYNKKAKIYTIESEMIKEFSGEWNLSKNGKKEIILSKTDLKLFLVKIDREQIALDNQNSGFLGMWNTRTEEGDSYLTFKAPDSLSIFTYTDYSSSNASGTWMYDKNNESVILMVRNQALRGSNKVVNIGPESFEIQNGETTFEATRFEQDAKDREKLNFTMDEVSESHDNRELNLSLNSTRSSWLNSQAQIAYLKNVKKLTYTHSSLLSNLDAFASKEIVANVVYDENYNQIIIDDIFGNLSASDYREDNHFYPIEEPDDYDYRVRGEEQITVPAGTFNCIVIEQADYDNKVKYYMISNRPGVYAKVIIEKEENYDMYELSEIADNFTYETNDIVGNWLLVKTKQANKTKDMSTNHDFVNDGRLSINKTGYGNFNSWTYNKENNSVSMEIDGEPRKFSVSILNESRMELQSNDQTYYFVKWDLSNNNNKESKLIGYWMQLEGGRDSYSLMQITEDNIYYEIDNVQRFPLDENYKMFRGQWMHSTTDSTLILKDVDHEAYISGQHKITKLNNKMMILNGKMVYMKINADIVAKNNKESELEGLWKIAQKDGSFRYYQFNAPYEFRIGFTEDQQNIAGMWAYDPDQRTLFIGAMIHQLEGNSVILEITKEKIKFQNGLEALRVK